MEQSTNGATGSIAKSINAPASPPNELINEPKKLRAVGVTLPLGTKPSKIQGTNPSEFLTIVQNSTLTWINFTVKDMQREGAEIAAAFGFTDSLLPTLLSGYYANFEDRDYELGIMLPAVRIVKVDLSVFPLIILVRKSLIVTIHSEDVHRLINFQRYADVYTRKLPESMPPEDKLTLLLFRIIDENNSRNFEQLREIEEEADRLSETLVDTKTQRTLLGRNIYELKHTLITYLNTLWRTLDVVNSLRYGDADLITDNQKVLGKMGMLVEDVNQQISLSEHMSEVLASGLEVLQSIYNNQLQMLNNRMALAMTWLTILGTAVLVPNTLATVGGMVKLEGPTLTWYIIIMILATLEATVFAWWWVKKRVNISNAEEWTPAGEPKKKRTSP